MEFAADTAIAVAGTLENAHNLQVSIDGKDFQGIVHGDIKPKNIRIDSHGEVRVLDFGIAKALSLSRRLTRNEFGSVPYASPERLDTGEVSADSDLWSLAVTLYEMVTGLQPYHAANTEQLERMIRSRIPPPPARGPLPGPAAPHPVEGHGAGPGGALRHRARFRGRPGRLPPGRTGARRRRGPGRHPPHLPATRKPIPTPPAASASGMAALLRVRPVRKRARPLPKRSGPTCAAPGSRPAPIRRSVHARGGGSGRQLSRSVC